jgi:hypothetical protein
LWASSLGAADELPTWLRQAAASPARPADAKAKAVVLLDEARVVVEEGGKITTTHLRAVRILTREGRGEASGRVIYQAGTGKVKGVHGWMIWPDGGGSTLGKDRVLDVEVAPNDVYNDVRAQVITASAEAGPGSVFGYETVLEDKSVFTQFEWAFQDDLPVVVSRFSISVPRGWAANGIVYNHANREPAVVGTSYTWELRDLPRIEAEPLRPALTSIAPWLAVSLVPAPGAHTGIGKTFEGWAEVARWLSGLAEPQTLGNHDLVEKALSLTRDARSEFERIQAIGRYVQGVNYVSIQTGVGRGGGYRPHPAPEVFARFYGDCKDKANLMRAMLKVVGTESYPVAVYLGDRERVRADWPSPQQFNHAIVAVALKDEIQSAAVRSYPGVGRLLFFDPTDEQTPMGFLPQEEEDSQALLVAPDQGALLRLPSSPPEANRLERHLEFSLAQDGTLAATVEEQFYGHAAAAYRRDHQPLGMAEDRKRMEAWVAGTGSGAQMGSLEVTDGKDGSVRVVMQFKTPRCARSMHGTMLLVNANVLPARNLISLPATSRKYPVMLNSESLEETMRMKLPEGFDVEEMPRPRRGSTAFGAHSTSCDVRDGVLSCRRSLTVAAGVLPVEKYAEARAFFTSSAGDETVVLAKKQGGPGRW